MTQAARGRHQRPRWNPAQKLGTVQTQAGRLPPRGRMRKRNKKGAQSNSLRLQRSSLFARAVVEESRFARTMETILLTIPHLLDISCRTGAALPLVLQVVRLHDRACTRQVKACTIVRIEVVGARLTTQMPHLDEAYVVVAGHGQDVGDKSALVAPQGAEQIHCPPWGSIEIHDAGATPRVHVVIVRDKDRCC